MRNILFFSLLAAPTLASATVVSGPDLGKAEGKCRPNEAGPAIIVHIQGLRDRQGLLKLEVYPSNDTDFLADDNILINAGKTFRRVEITVPQKGDVEMCVRIPGAGTYSLTVLHDRDGNHKLSLSQDGVGFAGNPKMHLRQPKASEARMVAGSGLTTIKIIMNYRHGLFSFRPD